MKKVTAPPKKSNVKKTPPSRSSWFQNRWLLLAVTLVITFVIYLPSLQNGWTNWDDNGYVIDNALVRTTNVNTHFSEFEVMGNYHPLTMLSLAYDFAQHELNAEGYHTTNLIIHLAGTAMVFFFLYLLFANGLVAAFGALVFGIHPMHVESVAWVSERKDVLYGFFYFAALVSWMRYVNNTNRVAMYGLTILLFALSLLSKGQAVTLPMVMVLIDWLRNRKFDAKAIIEKIPFFLMSIAFGVVAVLAQRESKAIQDIPDYTFLHRLLFAGYALFTYIWKFFVPINLSAFYPYPIKGTLPSTYYIGLVGAVILVGFAIWFFRKSKWMWFGLLFFGANIILLLQLLPVGSAVVAERYTYVAYTGLIIAVSYVLANGLPINEKIYKLPNYASIGIALVGLLFFAVQTSARIKVWNNSEALWTNVLEQFNYAPNAHNNLGSYYQKNERIAEALHQFNTALYYQQDFPEALINRSDIYRVRNKLDSAIADCTHAIEINPEYEGAYMNRGIARSIAGEHDSAMADFNKVLQLNPNNHKAYGNRGNLNDMRGRADLALRDYNKALELDPTYETVYGNRAGALYKLKRYDEALSDANHALTLNPNQPDLYAIRADIYVALGRYNDALQDAQTAQRLGKPINPAYIQMLQQRIAK